MRKTNLFACGVAFALAVASEHVAAADMHNAPDLFQFGVAPTNSSSRSIDEAHFIYIPAALILGFILGFILGGRATRDTIAAEQRRLDDKTRRQAERAARKAEAGPDSAAPGDGAQEPPESKRG